MLFRSVAKKIADQQAQLQAQLVSPESQKERHTFISKLADTLFRYPSIKLRPWGWLAAGLSTVALTTAAGYAAGKTIEAHNEGRTLADVIKNQPSWRTAVPTSVPKWFIQNVSTPSEKNFNALIQASASSFGISEANPSAKEKISNLLCKNVYNIEGAGVGLTKEQQEESALIIKNLQEVMKATKTPSGILYDKDVRLFGDLTIREFYEQVGKVVASADAEKSRLHKL